MDKPRIMVALGDVEHMESLVTLACEMSQAMRQDVLVVHVVEVAPALPLDAGTEVLDQPGRQLLATAQQFAQDRFAKRIVTRLIRGREAGPMIVREAEEQGTELLVMGYHRRSRLAKALLGSTVRYVIEHAPCRVIVEAGPAGSPQSAAA
jgi:nucleotide-binding universal stress UspA family protein